MGVLISAIFLIGMSYVLLKSALYTFLALLVLFVPITPFLLPTTYSFDDEGLEIIQLGTSLRIPYSDMRNWTFSADRSKLLICSGKRRETFLYLPNREIADQIAKKLEGALDAR